LAAAPNSIVSIVEVPDVRLGNMEARPSQINGSEILLVATERASRELVFPTSNTGSETNANYSPELLKQDRHSTVSSILDGLGKDDSD